MSSGRMGLRIMTTSLLLLAAAWTSVSSFPHHHTRDHHSDEVTYDQRQNGSENYRIHIDGVVIIHAPAESLLALAGAGDSESLEQQLTELLAAAAASEEGGAVETTPGLSAQSSSTTERPADVAEEGTSSTPATGEDSDKPSKNRSRLRLSSLLTPFLRRL